MFKCNMETTSSMSSIGSGGSDKSSTISATGHSLVAPSFIRSLRRDPERRTSHDIQNLYYSLRSLEFLSHQDDTKILLISNSCTYLKKSANDILYCRGELATCWYILLSGSVFIDGSMFLPITSFGRRPSGITRRPNECLILEPSEMICIEYMDSFNGFMYSRESLGSDTSSAYSGSDTMCSSNPSGISDEVDLTGLVESVVDSDEDEIDSIDSHSLNQMQVRDAVRECLEIDPNERSEHDLQVLLEFTQHLQAFNDLTINVRKSLVAVMVFAVVEKAGTLVLSDGEELDSWSVVVHGSVEVVDHQEGKSYILSPGDSFGLPPTLSKQYFRGQMRTRTDDCQFVCVTQEDYFRILKQGQDNQIVIKKDQEIVLVTEQRSFDNNLQHSVSVSVIRGTSEELMNQLVFMENPSGDPTYVEDYLLTQRIFDEDNQVRLIEKLITWFTMDMNLRDRVTRVVLLWVNNHFVDFEADAKLFSFLVRFQQLLEKQSDMQGQLRLLQIACSAKSRIRKVTIARKSRDDPLPFNIMGGGELGYGLYISSISNGNGGESCIGLRIGDEILELSGLNVKNLHLSEAFEKIKASTHIVLSVKCNFLGYYECLNSAPPLLPISSSISQSSQSVWSSTNSLAGGYRKNPNSIQNLSKHRLKKALAKIHLLPKKSLSTNENSCSQESLNLNNDNNNLHQHYFSANDLVDNGNQMDYPECVVKIYRPDQSFKYLLINKETTAREVIMLALQEFGEAGANSRDYSLFQVSASNEILKQTRLPDHLDSLAERIPLGARYYIKKQESSEQLIPDDHVTELMKECEVSFLNLNPIELALQLTLEDYAIFRQIEMTEFVDDLFSLASLYSTPNLEKFAQLVNKETFWVVTEVTKELNIQKRTQIIKRFVKVAEKCRECRNFNSMFAIISGLGHSCVSRLKLTWEKLGNKYSRHFQEMQALMDPSRNMGKYRALLAQSAGQTPMIPFYPVVRKDLTFIHLGNSTKMDNLINFEKMRMVAKEIRNLVQMSAAPFDTCTHPSIAVMNQLSNLTTTTGKRRKKSPLPNPKKMYEEANMVRKVKAYLAKLEVIEDENNLLELSYQCEPNSSQSNTMMKPPISTISINANKPRTNNPSPTPSSTSSNSSDSTKKNKFGTGSPGSYQKLMALSEHSSRKLHNTHSGIIHNKKNVDGQTSLVHQNSNRKLVGPTLSSSSLSNNNDNNSNTLRLSVESSSVLPANTNSTTSSSSISTNNKNTKGGKSQSQQDDDNLISAV